MPSIHSIASAAYRYRWHGATTFHLRPASVGESPSGIPATFSPHHRALVGIDCQHSHWLDYRSWGPCGVSVTLRRVYGLQDAIAERTTADDRQRVMADGVVRAAERGGTLVEFRLAARALRWWLGELRFDAYHPGARRMEILNRHDAALGRR